MDINVDQSRRRCSKAFGASLNDSRICGSSKCILLTMILGLLSVDMVEGVPESRNLHSYRGFSVTKISPQGDEERIIKWSSICARETVVDWGDTNLALREIWYGNGSQKLQFVYHGGILTDCVVDLVKPVGEDDVCSSALHWSDQGNRQFNVKVAFYEKDPDVLAPNDFPWLVSISELRSRCNAAQHQSTYMPSEISEGETHGRRSKRGFRDMIIAPGTKWCGPNHMAYGYKDLGPLDGLDRCCRRHDHCKIYILAFTEKYGLFNYLPFTLSHCSCDERFRSCLKMTKSSSANVIGKIFFNMVQTKCFVLKSQKICVKRTWWGKCLKQIYKKQAIQRNNLGY